MKKNYNVFSLIVLAFLFLMGSCKQDNDNPTPATDCQITQVVEGTNKTDFVYTNDLLTQINFDSAGSDSDGSFTFERNATNQITKAQEFDASGNSDFYLTYEYNSTGQIVKANVFAKDENNTFQNDAYFAYEYTNNVLTKSTLFVTVFGPAIAATSTEFTTDAKGNVTLEKNYAINPTNLLGPMELTGSTEYQYDDKKNPLKLYSFIYPNASTLSNNNITNKVQKDKNGATTSSQTTTYEYNEQGYPTKQTTTPTGGSARVSSLTYTCE